MAKHFNYVCFGEVLIDRFPDKAIIGGAPLNVATWLAKLKQQAALISAVGNDAYGKQLLHYMKEHHINPQGVDILPDLETGVVTVFLDEEGSATYTIKHPAAWDQIEWHQDKAELVADADALFYSTLALRSETNWRCLQLLWKLAEYNVFDVNLRPPFVDREKIIICCQQADFIKMNEDELEDLKSIYNSQHHSLEDNLLYLAEKTQTPTLCLTLGAKGVLILHDGTFTEVKAYPTKIEDTVGAGDAFLAAFISQFYPKKKVKKAAKFASAIASFVAASPGANPEVGRGQLKKYFKKIGYHYD